MFDHRCSPALGGAKPEAIVFVDLTPTTCPCCLLRYIEGAASDIKRKPKTYFVDTEAFKSDVHCK